MADTIAIHETTKGDRADKTREGRNYNRSFLVIQEDANEGILGALQARLALADENVRIGIEHPDDDFVRCTKITATRRAGTRFAFDFTCEYTHSSIRSDEQVDLPESRNPEISFDPTVYMVPMQEDLSDPPRPIINSAMQDYDPPLEIPVSRARMMVAQNEKHVTDEFMAHKLWSYNNTINSDAWFGADIGTLRVRLRASKRFENGIWYWAVEYSLEEDARGWQREGRILDAGFEELVIDRVFVRWGEHAGEWVEKLWYRSIVDGDGRKISNPVPLDGDGHAIDPQDLKDHTVEPYYHQFIVYHETAFLGMGIRVL
jgi:hypothetical protein